MRSTPSSRRGTRSVRLLKEALSWLVFPHGDPCETLASAATAAARGSSSSSACTHVDTEDEEGPQDKIVREAQRIDREQKRFQFALLSTTFLLFSIYNLLLLLFLCPSVEFTVHTSPVSFSPWPTHVHLLPTQSPDSSSTLRQTVSVMAVLSCSAYILHHYLRSITFTACFFFLYVNGSVWFLCLSWGPVGEFLALLVHVPVMAFYLLGKRAGTITLAITLIQTFFYTGACLIDIVPLSGNTLKMGIAAQMSAVAGSFVLLGLCSGLNERSREQAMNMYREAHARLGEQSKAKARFLANVSHELRTPLHGITAASEQLMNVIEKTSDQAHLPALTELCSIVTQSGQHMLALINDVLDLERMDTRNMKVEHVPFRLDKEFNKIIKMLEPTAIHKKIDLRCEFLVERCLRIGDSLRFRQVLVNILSNALKFTPQGGVVSVTAVTGKGYPLRHRLQTAVVPANSTAEPTGSKHKEHDGGSEQMNEEASGSFDSLDDEDLVTFVIQDTGIGMSEDSLSQVFKAFSQADVSTTRKFGGSGLGLTICKRLCHLMGGRVGVTSEEGIGSTFWFTLPLLPSSESPESTGERKGSCLNRATSSTTGSLEGVRVLLADDNKVNQTLERHILVRAGCEVVVVQDGEEAVRAWREQGPFDVILMDNHMPVMDGIEATKRIREAERMREIGRTAIIGLSASQRPASASVGMDEWLTKPFQSKALVEAVRRWSRH